MQSPPWKEETLIGQATTQDSNQFRLCSSTKQWGLVIVLKKFSLFKMLDTTVKYKLGLISEVPQISQDIPQSWKPTRYSSNSHSNTNQLVAHLHDYTKRKIHFLSTKIQHSFPRPVSKQSKSIYHHSRFLSQSNMYMKQESIDLDSHPTYPIMQRISLIL